MAEGLKVDPAIERWAHLRENTHLYYSFNKRNTNKTLLWGLLVPIGLTFIAYQTSNRWNFAGAQTKEEFNNQ
ncbi:hypothetical protein BY458DRAFT_458778 [Sporodiniella umbellata]|nr:hypothetical protein BY458DRAFT_458778 [Sporodiniella umbellata]